MQNDNYITPVKRFLRLLKVDKEEILSIYVYALFNGLVGLSLPLGIQAIINLVSGAQTSTSWVVLVVFVVLGVVFSGVLQILQLKITENLQQKIYIRSAFEFAYRIPRMKLEALNNKYAPELMNRFFDTVSIQKGISKIILDFSSASLQVIFGLMLLSLYHSFFIIFSMLLVLVVYLIFKYTAPKGLKTSIEESTYKYETAHWLEEIARTVGTFKLAGKTDLPIEKTDSIVQKYIVARKTHFKTLMTQYVNLVLFKIIIVASLLLIGSILVIEEEMNLGQFVAAEIIIILVISSVEKVISIMETIYDVLTSVEKLGKIFDIPLDKEIQTVQDPTNNESLEIDLQNVSFQYEGDKYPILKDLTLKVEQGSKICLAGQEGAGKSVFLQLIAGLFDEYEGNITYNSVSLASWCKQDLHALVGDNIIRENIFSGTILENITLGKTFIGIDEIREVSKLIGLDKYVAKLTKGYETELVSEGKNLPRSIRLKIMLVRSVVGNPKLILLEGHFNRLGKHEKEAFIKYLLTKKTTVIAVSNDSEIASQFESVLVLDKGRILANGSLESFKQTEWYKPIFEELSC